jgi:hypothetical protein
MNNFKIFSIAQPKIKLQLKKLYLPLALSDHPQTSKVFLCMATMGEFSPLGQGIVKICNICT